MAEEKVIVPIELTVTDIKTGDINLKDVQKSMESKLASIAKSAGDILGKVDTSKMNKALTSSMDKVHNSYDKLRVAQAKFDDAMKSAGSSSPAYKKNLEELNAEMSTAAKNYESIAKVLDDNPYAQSGFAKLDKGFSMSELTRAEQDAVNEQMRIAEQAEEQFADIEARMARLNPKDYISTATTTEVQKLINAYNGVFDAINKVDSANRKWNETKASNMMTDEYTKKLKDLDTYEKKLDAIKTKSYKMSATGASDKSWQNLIYDAGLYEQRIRDIILELQEMIRTGNAFRFGDGDAGEQLEMLSNRLNNLDIDMGEILNSSGRVTAGLTSIQKSLARFRDSVNKALSNAVSWFKKLGKASSRTGMDVNKSLKKMWKNILMFGFGVRSTYFLVRRLRKIFIESFKEMSTQIPEVNKDISLFVASLNQLKGSVATAFQPIVSAAIPALSSLITALSNAMQALGRFFATLTGQGYIYKFTADQVDYADSLDKTTKSAKKAQKALMGFDEINRLNDDSGSDGGGGGASTGTWEKEMIGGMSTLAELIKEAWTDGDFYEVGKYIGEKLLLALKTADDYITTNGYALSEKIGKSLGTLINGFIDTEGLSNQIGKTIADVYNMALIGVDKFLVTTDWFNLGQFIADGADSAVRSFDWSLLGKTAADLIKAGVDTWWKFVGEFDFYALGNKVATALNNMFSSILSEDGTGLNVAEKLGQAISNIVSGILTSLTTAINNTDWSAVGRTIGEVLANINWSGIWIDFKTLVGAIVGALVDAFYAWKDTDEVSAGIANFLGLAIAGINLAPVAVGLASSLLTAAQTVFGSDFAIGIADLLYDAFVGAKSVLSSISPESWGIVGIITGSFTAITNFIDMLKNGFSWFNEILMLLGTGVAAVGAVIAGLVTGPVAAVIAGIVAAVATVVVLVKDNWTEICNFVKGIPAWFSTNVITPVKNKFSTLGSNIKSSFSSCLSSVKKTWGGVTTWFSNITSKVQSKFKTVTAKIKSMFSSAWSSVKSGCKSSFNSVIASVEKGVNNLIKGINKVINGVNKIAGGAAKIAGIKYTAISTVPSVKLPRLAQGGVIPPNKEFMAILGDQKHGTNIEAPLDTIKQAVAEELTEYIDAMMTGFKAVVDAVNNKDLAVSIGDREVGRAAERYFTRQAVIRGT